MGSDEVPTLFARAMRYQAGDNVKTPFGPGRVRCCSDHKTHVEVTLAGGVVFYARVRNSRAKHFTWIEYTEKY